MAKGAIELNIPQSELQKFNKELKWYQKRKHDRLKFEMDNATSHASGLAKKKAPKGKGKKDSGEGKLWQGIHEETDVSGNDMTGAIISEQDYSAAVEYGTKPHIIRAKNKKVLANARKGQFFGKKVRHPGTEPQPFMAPAVRFAYKKMIKNIKKLFK